MVRNGEDNSPIFNGSATGNMLFDVKIESMLKLSPDDKSLFCLLSVNAMGCLVYLIKPLFSRMGDYRAWVVSVPRQVILTASDDLPSIVGDAMRALEAGDNPQKLSKWFQREYKERDFNLSLPEHRSKYAFRLYGKGCKVTSIDLLLGSHLLQKDYFDYEGVFLVSADRRATVRMEAMDDLSQKMLKTPAVVIPPQTLPQDVSLVVSKEPFDKPILSYKGARLKVFMKRPGYMDLEQQVAVGDTTCQVMLPAKMDWLYKVYSNIFNVVDEEDRSLNDANVEIEGKAGVGQKERCVFVPEAKARKARITVTRDGYESKTMAADLTQFTAKTPLVVKMKMVRNKVRYKVGSKISFEMDRTHEEMNVSPLRGYDVEETNGNVVTLRSRTAGKKGGKSEGKGNGRTFSKWALIRIGVGLLTGLVVGGVAGWLLGNSHGERVVREEVEQQRLAQLERERQIADSLENVRMVAFFDSIPNWQKAELDSVFDKKLKGLYDALNTYDFATVQTMGDEHHLGGSKQWHMLDSVLTRMNEKAEYRSKLLEITKNEDENKNKYYSPDGTITPATFLKKLEEARQAVDSQKP